MLQEKRVLQKKKRKRIKSTRTVLAMLLMLALVFVMAFQAFAQGDNRGVQPEIIGAPEGLNINADPADSLPEMPVQPELPVVPEMPIETEAPINPEPFADATEEPGVSQDTEENFVIREEEPAPANTLLEPAIQEEDVEIAPFALSDYDMGDVTFVNSLIAAAGLSWQQGNPDAWPTFSTAINISGIQWTETVPKRVKCINIYARSMAGDFDFSPLAELEILGVPYNYGITGINVSNNPKLVQLSCQSNALTSLDVSNNPMLGNLTISSNRITSMDVTNNPQLQHLDMANNTIYSFDVTQNPRLAYLDCGTGAITALDVSNNPNLYFLRCNNNALSTLDISNNLKLEELWCGGQYSNITTLDLRQHTKLRVLNISYMQKLTSVNVNGLSELEDINFTGSKVPQLDLSNLVALKKITGSSSYVALLDVSGSNALETVSLFYSRELVDLDMSNKPNLTKLEVRESTKLETLLVNGSTNLQTLYTYGCSKLRELDASGLNKLLELKSYNCRELTMLKVEGCTSLHTLEVYISTGTGKLASLDLRNLPSLITASCYGNVLTSLDLSGSTNLDVLYCNKNKITTLNLTDCTKLRYLYADYNDIVTLDLRANTLLYYLGCNYNTSLELVNVSGLRKLYQLQSQGSTNLESIDASGCSAITSIAVDSCSKLTSLDISGCTTLASLSCSRTALATLDVSGATNLSSLYCYNSKLTALDVSGLTKLTSLNCQNQSNSSLRSLNLSGTTLTTLDCSQNTGIKEFTQPSGEKLTLLDGVWGETTSFASYALATGEIRVSASGSGTFVRWEVSEPSVNLVGVSLLTHLSPMFTLPAGNDTTMQPVYSAAPTFYSFSLSNPTQTGGQIFVGMQASNGYSVIANKTGYQYRKQGETTWIERNGTLADTDTPEGNIYFSYTKTFEEGGTILVPNTTYEVQAYAENRRGEKGYSAIGTITTKPDFVSWSAAPSSASPATQATISGSYYEGSPITGATITYGKQANLSDGTTINLTSGQYTNTGFSYTLTGLDVGTTYYVSTSVTTAIGTTTSGESSNVSTSPGTQSFSTGWLVQVEYKNTASGFAIVPSTPPVERSHNTVFDVSAETQTLHNIGGKSYYPLYYKVTGDNTQYDLDDTYTITANTTISIYYAEANTDINVSIPTQLLWAAFESDGGTVQSPDYTIQNHSQRPVDVSLTSVNVVDADSINFVQNISGNGDLRLDLLGEAGSPFAGVNLTGVDTSGTPIQAEMGRLGGSVIEPTRQDTGKFTLGGQYQGGFFSTTSYKQPELSALLRLDLDMS